MFAEFERYLVMTWVSIATIPRSTDFHSLRHTCGAWLAMAGQHPKTIQSVMRHSTITLTMNNYGHLFPGSDVLAIAKLAAVMRGTNPAG